MDTSSPRIRHSTCESFERGKHYRLDPQGPCAGQFKANEELFEGQDCSKYEARSGLRNWRSVDYDTWEIGGGSTNITEPCGGEFYWAQRGAVLLR